MSIIYYTFFLSAANKHRHKSDIDSTEVTVVYVFGHRFSADGWKNHNVWFIFSLCVSHRFALVERGSDRLWPEQRAAGVRDQTHRSVLSTRQRSVSRNRWILSTTVNTVAAVWSCSLAIVSWPCSLWADQIPLSLLLLWSPHVHWCDISDTASYWSGSSSMSGLRIHRRPNVIAGGILDEAPRWIENGARLLSLLKST